MDAAGAPDGDSERRRLVILIVEDEVLVRAAAAHQLRGAGYTVLEAGNAAQALEVLQSSLRIHLVFTDVMMPGLLDGADLARVVLNDHPGVKVMLTSGAHRNAPDLEILPLLHKPYSFDELRRLVELLIGKADPI